MNTPKNSQIDLDFFENIIFYRSITDDKYLASIIDYIDPVFFKNKNISLIYELVCDFYRRNNTCPTLTEIKTLLTSDKHKDAFKDLVNSFKDIDKNINEDELYNNTEKFLKEKAVYTTMLNVAEKLSKNEINTSEILKKFEKSCSISLTTNFGTDFLKNIDLIINDLNKEEKYIKTGFNWLDHKLGGGFLENGKSLYIFAGVTNIGKSIFLANIATNIASQNKTVLLVSLEMSEMIYSRRLCSTITKIPVMKLKSEQDILKSSINEYNQKLPNSRILVKEFPPSTITPLQLTGFIKKVVSKGNKIDAIVLDYVNLLHSSVGNNSYERVKYVSEQIRAISYIFNCPVITATQLNRSGYNIENPNVETISESMGLANTADAIFNIYQTEEERELGVIHLGVIKNRFGPNFGNILLRLDYSTLSLTQDDSINETEESSAITNTLSILSNS